MSLQSSQNRFRMLRSLNLQRAEVFNRLRLQIHSFQIATLFHLFQAHLFLEEVERAIYMRGERYFSSMWSQRFLRVWAKKIVANVISWRRKNVCRHSQSASQTEAWAIRGNWSQRRAEMLSNRSYRWTSWLLISKRYTSYLFVKDGCSGRLTFRSVSICERRGYTEDSQETCQANGSPFSDATSWPYLGNWLANRHSAASA